MQVVLSNFLSLSEVILCWPIKGLHFEEYLVLGSTEMSFFLCKHGCSLGLIIHKVLTYEDTRIAASYE